MFFCVDDSYQNEGMLSSADYFLDFLLLGYSIQEAVSVWLVEFSCATVTKYLKEAAADPTWVQSTIATMHGMS